MARALMFQGTGSDVGKSLIVAGLCRAFHRRGIAVAPFKPQNMSNNAAIAEDGREIGRAQALQARAAGLAAEADMNPVLLKPEGETGAQIVLKGERWGRADARGYQQLKEKLLPEVMASFRRLDETFDLVLVEGAGSPAEINLRAGDIANMGFAAASGVPVVLIGDIDRGGAIAQIVGTMAVLPAEERDRVRGFLINKFRGDPTLFESGLAAISERTGLEALGLVPWFRAAGRLPAEDAMALETPRPASGKNPAIRIAVPRLPRIANFDDLDPLAAEADVAVEFIPSGDAVPGDTDLVLLPGSKATLADLAAFRTESWDVDLHAHLRRGGHVLGICAGFQMLGRRIADPGGIEGRAGAVDGLGWLDIETRLGDDKRLARIEGRHLASGQAVSGYEMHLGQTAGADLTRPFLKLAGADHGAVSADGRVMGCYLHGLFAADGFRRAFLDQLGRRTESGIAYEAGIETALDRLAEHLAAALDLDRLWQLADQRYSQMSSTITAMNRPAAWR